MGIEVILTGAIGTIDFHQVRGIHDIPLPIHLVGEDRTFIPPLGKILHGRGPHANIRATILIEAKIVRAYDIGTILTRVVWVFKHARLSIG